MSCPVVYTVEQQVRAALAADRHRQNVSFCLEMSCCDDHPARRDVITWRHNMGAWYDAFRDGTASSSSSSSSTLLRILSHYGDGGSRDNASVSWAEYDLSDNFTASPCLTLDNASCSNMTSLDDGSMYPYTIWQVSFLVTWLYTVFQKTGPLKLFIITSRKLL